jgi:hypothetical protein
VGFGGAAAIAFVTDDARNMNENYSFPALFCPPPPPWIHFTLETSIY